MIMKTAARFIPTAVIVGCAFIYGLVVGTYKVFPFEQILYVKELVAGKAVVAETANEARESERYQVYYLDKKSFFEKQATQADIVMVGDSLVDGAEWSELLPGYSIANRGIAGDSIEGILNRMDSIYSIGAKKAVIMAGYNDVRKARPVKAVFRDYKAVIDGLLAHGTKPYVASTILVGNELNEWNNEINELNEKLERYSRKKDLQFIDLNEFLSPQKKLDLDFTRDGIHLNGKAYKLVALQIKPYLSTD